MLTYTPPQHDAPPKTTEKPWLLLCLAFVWLWPAIFGHDLWKPDEPYIYQSVKEMLDSGTALATGAHGEWLVKNPPLYAWVGAFFHEIFSPWLLSGYDAVRLATPFFMSIGLAFSGGAGRQLLGRRNGRSVALILIGCAGLMVVGHQMDSMAATFMGYAMAMYAFSLAPKSPGLSGAILAGAWVVVLLSSSLLELSFLVFLAFLLPCFSHWRNRQYLICLVFALILAIPLGSIWPLSLQHELPAVFNLWWNSFAWGSLGHFNRTIYLNDLTYYPIVVLWYTFPAWPLAVWSLIKYRHVNNPALQLCVVWFILALFMLTLLSEARTEKALVLLLPLAILGAAQLDTLKRSASAFLDWFGIMTFGALAIYLWIGFFAMNFGWPKKIAERSLYFSPYYSPDDLSILAVIIAILVTPIWIWAVTRKHTRGRQAVTNWAAGMTFAWVLLFTLWLPWIDKAKSFRPVVEHMEASVPAKLKGHLKSGRACMSTDRENRTLILAWREYGSLPLKIGQSNCYYKMVVNDRDHTEPPEGWKEMWQGARPRDKDDIFALWKKN